MLPVIQQGLFSACLLLVFSCGAQTNFSTADLKNGKFKEDSSYIYSLPFQTGKKVFLVQGYESMFSHKGEKALDFKTKKGTVICAARAGVVESVREDSDKGGLKPENLSDGNYITIRHADGSLAWYWHLKKDGVLVNTGDTVQNGQAIGLSGNTGYSAFPHLHFEVQGKDGSGNFTQLPTRFYTRQGVIYLRPGKFYRTRR
ncbi:MAG: M23 family metallopeptidase [Sphingobacteriales bacterium]|nr:M23 family metallopeptidase [Sphingobacteriales bacterium]